MSSAQPETWTFWQRDLYKGPLPEEQKVCQPICTGKGTYTRALSQKNRGSVEAKQRPVKMGGRTTYKTLSPKRAPFQIGIDRRSHLRKVPRRGWISHTYYPVWLCGCSPYKTSSPGPVLRGTKWLLWRPHIQSPTLHSRCGINKGLFKRGNTVDHWKSRCKGWILWPTPYAYIHTYLHTTWTSFKLTRA
jgi:hypothetical protein